MDKALIRVCRIILDASTRRFQAHKIYLRASAGMRWVQMRAQVLRGEKPAARHVNALRAVDQRLRQVCVTDVKSTTSVDRDRRFPTRLDSRYQNHVEGDTRRGSDLQSSIGPQIFPDYHAFLSFRNAQANKSVQQELNDVTDEHVVRDLRNADRRKGYWIDEDPTLERMLVWIRRQR